MLNQKKISRRTTNSTIRLFHLTSLHGPFVAQEMISRLRSSAFPYFQSDLYELHQPALCLIDSDDEIFIWQGWTDHSDEDLGIELSNANLIVSGPTDLRFTAERRCALQTALDYRRGKKTKRRRKSKRNLDFSFSVKFGSNAEKILCSIVYAGLEPIEFVNLFPKWFVHSKARQENQLVRSFGRFSLQIETFLFV